MTGRRPVVRVQSSVSAGLRRHERVRPCWGRPGALNVRRRHVDGYGWMWGLQRPHPCRPIGALSGVATSSPRCQGRLGLNSRIIWPSGTHREGTGPARRLAGARRAGLGWCLRKGPLCPGRATARSSSGLWNVRVCSHLANVFFSIPISKEGQEQLTPTWERQQYSLTVLHNRAMATVSLSAIT